ncbi:unnamed protein product [Coregonus sp. 'balchen']|nr:unnamed protein product [Coregonus sp. 'balchen']
MLTTHRCAKALQLTLAVIKPDAMAHPLILEALHQRILENNFIIVRSKDLVWRRQDSEKFYSEHAGRFFYQRLVEFMSSGPMRAYVLAREDAITHWRELMDSAESARREIGFFFPDFSQETWMESEEPGFRNGRMEYDQNKQIHTLPVHS